MSDSPEAIRANIDRTRRELGLDVDALADKVTPSKIVDRQADKVKGAFGSLRDRLFGAADNAGSAVHDAGSSVRDAGSSVASNIADAGHQAKAKVEGSPLAVGLVAFGVGLALASLIPASQKEKEVADAVKDQAQPLIDEAQNIARELGGNLKEPAQEAVGAVKDTAADAVSNVKNEATDAASTVTDRAQEARSNVSNNS